MIQIEESEEMKDLQCLLSSRTSCFSFDFSSSNDLYVAVNTCDSQVEIVSGRDTDHI